MYIALQYTYYVDVIYVPTPLGKKIKSIQNLFDEWLYDKTNDHGNWVIIDGEKVAVSFDSNTFIEYINEYHLTDGEGKAYVTDFELQNVPDICFTTLFF